LPERHCAPAHAPATASTGIGKLHGFRSVRVKQTVLITDDGCETLTAAVPLG
jgi:Xaa-Pro aminopeptidase